MCHFAFNITFSEYNCDVKCDVSFSIQFVAMDISRFAGLSGLSAPTAAAVLLGLRATVRRITPKVVRVNKCARIKFSFWLWYLAPSFRVIKICIETHYLKLVLLCDRILVGVIKIQMIPFRDFRQSENLFGI